jgi:hypothetical protein
MKNVEIIYYTHNQLEEPIFSIVQKQLLEVGLPIVSCSLKPMDFGKNIVLDLEPGIVTMLKQILTALEASTADIVFFAEHDVLLHKSHFSFIPSRDDIFYYNTHVYRWRYPTDLLITYDHLKSLSGMCCNRELAIRHYKKRLEIVEKTGWQLKYGFEPGSKKRRRGGISDEECEEWKSEYPNIDIRHKGTLTPSKCHLASFKHPPTEGWKEINISDVSGWNLRDLFNL